MRQRQWLDQWSAAPQVDRDEEVLLQDWIYPNRLEDLQGKTVLDAGCGSGQHTRIFARYARRVIATDLNTAGLVRKRTAHLPNVRVVEADVTRLSFAPAMDAVFCIGVIHHTADPDRVFRMLCSTLRPGGRVVVWAYSYEGNALVRTLVEPFKRAFLRRASRDLLWAASAVLTAGLYLPVYTLWAAPLPFLPYHEYFANFRRLSFAKNWINVFDKLNAPTTHFLTRERVERWLDSPELTDVHVSACRGVSWRISATRSRPASGA